MGGLTDISGMDFLPVPTPEPKEGKLVIATEIAPFAVTRPDFSDYIQVAWHSMYEKLVNEIVGAISGRDDFVAIRFHPSVHHTNFLDPYPSIKLYLQAEVYRSKTANIIVPKMVYDDTVFPPRITEWRCGACASPNQLQMTHCTQCGYPRALLSHEYDRLTQVTEWRCPHCTSPNSNKDTYCKACGKGR